MISTALLEQLDQAIKQAIPEIIDLRHQLHHEPEPGRHEQRTRAKLADYLATFAASGMVIDSPLLETDLIANLNVDADRTIGLRADIDALPIREKTDLPYRSENGYMHACGHDGHTAILLGTAKVLSQLKGNLKQNVRFIFQPGEEMLCAGKELVAKGACSGLDQVFALHGWPGLPLGQIATKPGILFACGGHFRITIHGKGCHGAQPQRGINPITATAEVINELENLHHRIDHEDSSLVSVCKVESGFCSNVIPESATIDGTFRCNSTERLYQLKTIIHKCVEGIILKRKCTMDADFDHSYDTPLRNSEEGFRRIKTLVEAFFPEGYWYQPEKETKGMEDFAFYTDTCPNSAMFWLGTGEHCPPLHNPHFDFPDGALEWGIRLFCLLALATD